MPEPLPTSDFPNGHAWLFHRRTLLIIATVVIWLSITWLMPHSWLHAHDPLLDPARIKLGIALLACMAFLWLTETLPLAATALLIPILASVCGILDIKTSLQPFADPLIFLFFGGFALGSALSAQKLDQWLANRLIRWGRGSLVPVSLLLFACTAFLSMWMSNTATTAMMLPIALGLLRQIGEKAKGNNTLFLLLGIAYSAGIGGLGTLIGSPPNGIAAAKLDLSFTQWMAWGIPCVLVFLPLMAWILWLICRPDCSIKIAIQKNQFIFHRQRKITLAIFVTTALCWICGTPLARAMGVSGSIDSVIALAAVLALVVSRVISWEQIIRGTDWSVLFLFGGGLALSEVLSHSGTSAFLAQMVSAQIVGSPAIVIAMVAIAFAMVSAAFTSNTGAAALLVPIFYAVAKELNMPPSTLVIPLALASSCSFLLPVSTPPNAIVYGTGLVPQKIMIKNGFLLSIVCFVLLSLSAYFFL